MTETRQHGPDDVLTTGQVAKICSVAPRTVSKWFDSGRLRGYRIPGSKDRRIPVHQLVRFMRAHGMPLGGVEGLAIRVLLVDGQPAEADAAATKLTAQDRYAVAVAGNDFDAGMQAERFRPHVILMDVLGDGIDAGQILRNLRANPSLSATRVVAAAGRLTAGQKKALLDQGFDGVCSKPYDPTELVRVIEQATDLAS